MHARLQTTTMAKRVALIPEELVSSYHLQKPEMRIEDEMESLLEKSKLPNDMKVKLLGHMITRYHKTTHEPPEPVRVSVSNEQPQQDQLREGDDDGGSLKDIMLSVPPRSQKYIPLIVEKLKSRQYSWNARGEMTQDEKPILGSKIADLFSYIMRNGKTLQEPSKFEYFLNAIKEINIPRTWVVNKKVLSHLEEKAPLSNPNPELNPLAKNRRRRRIAKNLSELADWGSDSETPKKWLAY